MMLKLLVLAVTTIISVKVSIFTFYSFFLGFSGPNPEEFDRMNQIGPRFLTRTINITKHFSPKMVKFSKNSEFYHIKTCSSFIVRDYAVI